MEPIMQFFAYEHLPPHLQCISRPFAQLAHAIVNGDNNPESGTVTFGPPLPRNAERSTALRKLLEAKDAAVRAALFQEPKLGSDYEQKKPPLALVDAAPAEQSPEASAPAALPSEVTAVPVAEQPADATSVTEPPVDPTNASDK